MSASRIKVVLYNPRAVFFTMPLALLAIGSELDPDLYEVVIIDGRLDADAEATVLSAPRGGRVPRRHGAHGRTHLRCAADVARREAARPELPVVWGGWHPSMFAPRMPAPSRPSTSPCRGRARRRSWRSSRRSPRSVAAKAALDAPCGLRTAPICQNPPRRAAATRHVPRARLSTDPGRALLRAQGQAAARLHLLAGLQLPLRVLLGPVRLRAQVGRAATRRSMVLRLRGIVGAVSLRRRQFPGRDLLHAARSRASDAPSRSSSPE